MNYLRHYINTLHCDTSDRAIIRDMRGRMVRFVTPNGSKLPIKPIPDKGIRKAVYRDALKYHRDNQALYRDVVSGNL